MSEDRKNRGWRFWTALAVAVVTVTMMVFIAVREKQAHDAKNAPVERFP